MHECIIFVSSIKAFILDISLKKIFISAPQTSNMTLEKLYAEHYNVLCKLCFGIVRDRNHAEDIVQELFTDIWYKRDSLRIENNLEGYLKRAARNRSLNFIRDNVQKWETEDELINMDSGLQDVHVQMEVDEVQMHIEEAINQLPEKCGLVFYLSRFEDMSYSDIATHLDISIKTVENQMSKALKLLRQNILNNRNIS